jgi:ribonuclease D
MTKTKYHKEISAEELMNYELSWFKGEIVIVDDLKTFSRILPYIRKNKILGFDTETRPSFRKGRKNKVSLIQLATSDLACLFRINRIGIPQELADILADHDIIKAGVAVHDDIKFLKKMVKDFGIKSSGLKKLAAIVLGFRISKRQQVTDWEAHELTEAQQVYAATDAWVCYEIFKKLQDGIN